MTLPSRNDIRHEPTARLGLFVFLVAAILFPALSVAESPVGPVPAGFNATKQSDGVWRFDRQADNSTPAFWQQLLNLFNLRPATRPAFGRSVAFLTGVAKYDNLRPQLPYVDSDLTELRNFLLTQGGFDTVYEARDDVVRRSLIEDYLVNKFSSDSNLLGKDDRLLFYYSGHGADRNGRIGFLEFKQSQAGIFSGDEVLEVDEFARWSRIIVAKHLLVILDSCASGLAASSKVGESSEDRRQMEINSLSGEGSGYLITAGTEAQKAYQLSLGNQKGYSVLTHALLTAMRQGQNDDAFMTINEVFGKAEKSIASFNADQGKRMTPRIFSISRESGEAAGTFVFVNISAKNPPPPPASTGIIVAKGGGTGIVPELVAKDRIIAEEREQIEVQKGSIAGLQKEVDDLRDSSKDTRSAEQIQSLHDLIAAQNMKIKDLQDPLLQREMQNQLKSISNELDLVCESFAECMSRGQRAYHSNDFSAALGFFRQSAIINPELPLAWHWVGHASMAAGRTEEAFAAWDRILALHGAIPLTACEEVGQPMCEGGTLTIMAETLARYKGDNKVFDVPFSSVRVLNAANRRSGSHITFDLQINGVSHVFDFFPMGFNCPWKSSVTCPTDGQNVQVRIGEYAARTIQRQNAIKEQGPITPAAAPPSIANVLPPESAPETKSYTVQWIKPSGAENVRIWPGSETSNTLLIERLDGAIIQKAAYTDIAGLDINRKRVRISRPGELILVPLPGAGLPKTYQLCFKISGQDKKQSYCFVSESAACSAGEYCREGSDGGVSVQLLANDIKRQLQAHH